MTIILKAEPVVQDKLKQLKQEVSELKKQKIFPKLGVILVGSNPASLTYVNHKKNQCQKIGAECKIIELPENIKPEVFEQKVEELNTDDRFHGLLIQLPLPDTLSRLPIYQMIHPDKDVDGFHFENVQDIYYNFIDEYSLMPCTPKGIISLFEHYKIPISGQKVAVLGRSIIVGKPIGMLMSNLNGTVTFCHSRSKNIEKICRESDIIIAAIGKPLYVDHRFAATDKAQTWIDVGIHRTVDGKLVGDIHFDDLMENAPDIKAITPVPGGVGPLTVISLIENLIIACKKRVHNV